MGRASRKKNRLRSVDGGVYSKIGFENGMKDTQKIITSLRKGISIETDQGIFSNVEEFFDSWAVHLEENGFHGLIIAGGMFMNYFINTGKYHNIFIAAESVTDFIENQQIKVNDMKYIPDIIDNYCPHYQEKMLHDMTNGKAESLYHASVVHFINRKYSLFFLLFKNSKEGFHNIYYHNFEGGQGGTTLEGYEDRDCNIKNININFKRILNLFLYIDAFPEAIKSGPPPVKRLDLVKSLSNTTIGETEAIKGLFDHNSGHHVSPHLRRGHYRFLQSDRYKKKRFQTVFVRPSMVKGTADHIIDVDKSGFKVS